MIMMMMVKGQIDAFAYFLAGRNFSYPLKNTQFFVNHQIFYKS